jgi:hypothetical protein
MSVLSELQEAAVRGDVPLEELLRRGEVLAFRLAHDPLKRWVRNELDGYGPDEPLPAYRSGLEGVVKADTLNPARRLSIQDLHRLAGPALAPESRLSIAWSAAASSGYDGLRSLLLVGSTQRVERP